MTPDERELQAEAEQELEDAMQAELDAAVAAEIEHDEAVARAFEDWWEL
jgi:hypothetical protein